MGNCAEASRVVQSSWGSREVGRGNVGCQFCEWTHTEHIFLCLFLACRVIAEKSTELRDKGVKVTG